jgi:hypothetical protein
MTLCFEINGAKRTLEIVDVAAPNIEGVIKRWLHMEWLKENGITSRVDARASLANINFDDLKKKYGFKAL